MTGIPTLSSWHKNPFLLSMKNAYQGIIFYRKHIISASRRKEYRGSERLATLSNFQTQVKVIEAGKNLRLFPSAHAHEGYVERSIPAHP